MTEDFKLSAADIENYYIQRGLVWPSPDEAMLWLVSEIGEVADDLLMLNNRGWVRNNDQESKTPEQMCEELGDVVMMAVVMGLGLGHDPLSALKRKMARKMAEDD